jgi:predicted transcriptional regulator
MLGVVYVVDVTALKAHVLNGRIVVDEPVDLSDEERGRLERALERSLAQADAGELIEADEVLAELAQRP